MGNMDIIFSRGQKPEFRKDSETYIRTGITVPYKYVFTFGVFLFFTGMGVMLLSGRKNNLTMNLLF